MGICTSKKTIKQVTCDMCKTKHPLARSSSHVGKDNFNIGLREFRYCEKCSEIKNQKITHANSLNKKHVDIIN